MLAQIIRYFHPANSFGYNYATMLNRIGNNEVSRLMRNAGTAVGMNYDCGGSSASFTLVIPALQAFFGLSGSFSKSTTTGYYTNITTDIHQSKPVMLSGCTERKTFLGIPYPAGDCHAWVCDGSWELGTPCVGFQFLHMNWGWHEVNFRNDFNGWYAITNWNIPLRALNFQYFNEVIYDIK